MLEQQRKEEAMAVEILLAERGLAGACEQVGEAGKAHARPGQIGLRHVVPQAIPQNLGTKQRLERTVHGTHWDRATPEFQVRNRQLGTWRRHPAHVLSRKAREGQRPVIYQPRPEAWVSGI